MAQLAARRSHNPKVASSILAGSIAFFFFAKSFVCVLPPTSRELDFVRVARLSVGWPSGPRR